jgi:hypothetical protein
LGGGWADGRHLDRFSAFDLGSLRGLRVSGVSQGRFRGSEAAWVRAGASTRLLPRLSAEVRVDHARLRDLDDPDGGWSDVTGVMLAGRTPGPWGTLLSLELAGTVNQPGDPSWSAFVLVLKPL